MKEGHQNAWDILTKMVQFCPTIELDIVREFCVDFDIPFDTAVLMCLQHLILSWKPDISIVKNRDGIEGKVNLSLSFFGHYPNSPGDTNIYTV
jgi:hypothetical protein